MTTRDIYMSFFTRNLNIGDIKDDINRFMDISLSHSICV